MKLWEWLWRLTEPKHETCQRKGHVHHTEIRSGYRWPSARPFSAVADHVIEERTVCTRCEKVFADWQTKERSEIHGLSMENWEWEILKRDGALWGR